MKLVTNVQFIESFIYEEFKKFFTWRNMIKMNYFHVIDMSTNAHDPCFFTKNVSALLLIYVRIVDM